MPQSTTIVIVHYQNQELLKKQLQVLGSRLPVVVVDNSQDLKKKDLPKQVKLISLPFNMGFAHACNLGLAEVKTEWTLFLNPDVEITQEQVEEMISQAKKRKLVAASPLPKDKNYRQPLPSGWSLLNQFTPLKKLHLPTLSRHKTLTGGVLLIKTKVIKNLNGWDERFFLWFEDSDLTQRLVTAKHKIGWLRTEIKHHGGGSVKKLTAQQQRDLFFNAFKIYAHKYFTHSWQKIINLIAGKYTQQKLLPTPNSDLVSIVVPNLKKELLTSFLEENRPFLSQQNRQIEWIVVSSALQKDDLWQFRKKFPHIRFVKIDHNNGFAQTVNIGMKVATGSWIGTINDDVKLTHDWLDQLLKSIEKKKSQQYRIGSLNPVIKNQDQIESIGIKVLPKGKAEPITKVANLQPSQLEADLYKVDATNAAAVIYSQQALNKVGLFDERFGSYLEDIDLSLRLEKAGFINVVNTQVEVQHLKHQTSSKITLNKSWLDLKNWWLVILKNWSFNKWLKFLPQILIERVRNLSGFNKSLTWGQRLNLFLVFLLPILYVISRFYQLESSLLFFNDIGRDLAVLFDWTQTGKPPLLGPQTSALPYNQSAIYFYLLMPFYLLTGHSAFSTIVTALVFYLVLFFEGAWQLKSKPVLLRSLLLASFLILIHPQFILQTRFVWNPSFVGPLILVWFYALVLLREKFSWKKSLLAAGALTLAVSLNYSAAPVLIAFMLVIPVIFRRGWQWLKILVSLIGTAIFWNLPTLFFELRHKFLLTKMLFYQEKIPQLNTSLAAKTMDLIKATLTDVSIPVLVIALWLILIGLSMWWLKRKDLFQLKTLSLAVVLLILSIGITFLAPIAIQSHYIFGILSLALLVISLLEWKLSLVMVLILSSFWLRPSVWQKYTAPAINTVAEIENCAQLICEQTQEPVFVSNQASWHPYHNAQEWQYMFKEHGCQIKSLDTQRAEANKMLVVVDHSTYEPGKTAYNELTQFGPSRVTGSTICKQDLEVVVLEEDN